MLEVVDQFVQRNIRFAKKLLTLTTVYGYLFYSMYFFEPIHSSPFFSLSTLSAK